MARQSSKSLFPKFFVLGGAAAVILAMLWIRDTIRNDITVFNMSGDSVDDVVLVVSTGERLPVRMRNRRGRVSFSATSDAELLLAFRRNGLPERSQEFGYVTTSIGADYDVTINDDGVETTYVP